MGSDLIDGVEERSHLGSQRAKRRRHVFILPRRFDNLDGECSYSAQSVKRAHKEKSIDRKSVV